jgi:NSS family neurotransmitter:Na+ symporter
VGRGSQKSAARSFHALQPKGAKWHIFSYFAVLGNYALMFFYTVITGWMFNYIFKMANGSFSVQLASVGKEQYFDVGLNNFLGMLGSPGQQVGFMVLVCVLGFGVCWIGLKSGVERVAKILMGGLFVILVILAIRSITLPGAGAGLAFFLVPNPAAIAEHGLWKVLYTAMGQAFFSLSLGMGSMAIFGSYIDKDRTLTGEAVTVSLLDTAAALLAGFAIFPAVFAFGAEPGAGAGLVFMTMPGILHQMPGGTQVWGTLFFILFSAAAFTTIIAVFENLVAYVMDLSGCDRKKSILINAVVVMLVALTTALSFNVWSGPIGNVLGAMRIGGDMSDFWDFLISQNILPIGSAIYILFCMTKKGWGYKNFLEETDTGMGISWPQKLKGYFTYVLPAIIALVFIAGYINKFTNLLNVSF